MSSPNERIIGNSVGAPFVGYGDDSQHGNTLAFAVVLMPRSRVQKVERRVEAIKRHFKFPPDIPLHCRQLLHEDQRRKSGLDRLDDESAMRVVGTVFGEFNQNMIAVRYAIADVADLTKSLGDQIELGNRDEQIITLPVHAEPKGMLSFLAQAACSLAPNDGSMGPPADQCEFILAEDRTKTPFIGPGRRQAHSRYSGFLDVGAAEGEVLKLVPRLGAPSEYPLLQLADITSYACSHSNDQSERGKFFREQLGRLRWLYRSEMMSDLRRAEFEAHK